MKINVFGKKTLLSNEIKKYTDDKLEKLTKYRSDIIGIDLTLELDHHKKEKTAAVAKALVKIPGDDITAKAEARTLFAAIDELENKLANQLKKNKAKKSLIRNRLSKSKMILRGFIRRG